MRMASSVEMPSHSSTAVPDGTRCPFVSPSISRIFAESALSCSARYIGDDPSVAPSVASLQIDGKVYEAVVA